MKVYIISCNWGRGGPGGIVKDLYNTLVDQHHEVRIAYGRYDVPQSVNAFCFSGKVDMYLHFAMSRLFDKEGFCSKGSTKRLIKDIEEFSPDIINIHNELGHVINVPMLVEYIRKSKIRTVWTLHDAWLLTGHCITGLCNKVNIACDRCPRKRQYPSTLFDFSKKNYRKKKQIFLPQITNLSFITPSKWLRNLVSKSYLSEYAVTVINNGIDLSVFKYCRSDLRNRYNLDDKVILLAVAGIWSDYKGITYFNELTYHLSDEYAFVVIGDNIPDYVHKNEKIISVGRTNNVNELVAWYSAADIFINPTMGDNFPTVNIEALACGLPVVTFDTGGSGESVGTCGMTVTPGNIPNMIDAIYQVRMKRISRECCAQQARKYDKFVKYAEYLNVFLSLHKEDSGC